MFLLLQEKLHLFVFRSALDPLKLLQGGRKVGSNISRPQEIHFLADRRDLLLQIGNIGRNGVVELPEIPQTVNNSGKQWSVFRDVYCFLDQLDAGCTRPALLRTALSLRPMHAAPFRRYFVIRTAERRIELTDIDLKAHRLFVRIGLLI